MKKITALFLAVLCMLCLFGCSDTATETDETVPVGIVWSDTTADNQLVGTWKVEGATEDEVKIFTEDCKIRLCNGSLYLEGDVYYGVDSTGNHKLQSDFHYMSGEFTYFADEDKAIFVSAEGVSETLIKVEDFVAPTLDVPEDFSADNPLIGTWYNEDYQDSYTFNADGTASYDITGVDIVFRSHIDYTYKVVGDKVHFTYDAGDGAVTTVSSFTITDGELDIDGVGDYMYVDA